jgi:uncharacterized protein YjbI with pentapeptide repeats
MKLIFESWRKHLKEELLSEVTYKEAKEIAVKAYDKLAKSYAYDVYQQERSIPDPDRPIFPVDPREVTFDEWDRRSPYGRWGKERRTDYYKSILVKNMSQAAFVPTDIPERYKGQALLWIMRLAKKGARVGASVARPVWTQKMVKNPEANPLSERILRNMLFIKNWWSAENVIHPQEEANTISHNLEMFFNYNDFMETKDLNKLKSPQELKNAVDKARHDIKAYQDKKTYANTEEGTNVLLDNEDWFIAALKNKGAACHYGKETDWCTAAPGLDYAEQYISEGYPLFFFKNKQTGEKYQFTYNPGPSSDEVEPQFQDALQNDVPFNTFKKLHDLLISSIQGKYKSVKRTSYKIGNIRNYYRYLYDFRHADLPGADLRNVDFDRPWVWNNELDKWEVVRHNFSGANLEGANLEGVILSRALCVDTNFKNANLRNAIFDESIFKNVDFEGADLQGASFVGAELNDANFTKTKSMERIILQGAELYNAHFGSANLAGADLSNSYLQGADFLWADLSRVKHAEDAHYDHKTVFPPGPPPRGMRKDD